MEEWKASFRDIYGRSPTPGDFEIAPSHLKENLKIVKNIAEEDENKKKRGVKRKNFEMKMMEGEQFSPVKKRTALKPSSELKISPKKREFSLDDFGSPEKRITFKKDLSSVNKSPSKSVQKKILTPSRRQVNFDDLSPLKTPGQLKSTGLTPIKSPTKKTYQRKLIENKDLEMLLLPTPEKIEEEEEDVNFEDETTEEVAAMKAARAQRRLGGAKKKPDMNFQKINLRKKQFVRGKVTAEQKRKLKRRQMFKKKT